VVAERPHSPFRNFIFIINFYTSLVPSNTSQASQFQSIIDQLSRLLLTLYFHFGPEAENIAGTELF
jgi:hypothetical protein